MPAQEPIIRLTHVAKTFTVKGVNVEALKDISLDVPKGDIFGIIGESGAGKSTLVRCVNFLEVPTSGQVLFEGRDLSTLQNAELLAVRRKMAMIFQQFNLFMQRTALKNICYPMELAKIPKVQAEARARELLETVGLPDKADAYPAQLSGGQKQRIAIARALATNPAVLLCDEVTSALDPMTTSSILALLKEINEKFGITILVITHEMGVIEKICQDVAVISSGRVAETGPVKEVFVRPQSDAAKELIRFDSGRREAFEGGKVVKVSFEGQSSAEPLLANMISLYGAPVNIMGADTCVKNGIVHGEMLVQLPKEELTALKMMQYFTDHTIPYEEVEFHA